MDPELETEARDQLDLVHRLHREVLDAVLRVAKETGRDPGELAQLIQMGGGGFGGALQPLVMRWHEQRQRQFMASQQPPPQT